MGREKSSYTEQVPLCRFGAAPFVLGALIRELLKRHMDLISICALPALE